MVEKKAGGINYLLHQIKRRIKSKISTSGNRALVGFAITNNTVSIVIRGLLQRRLMTNII
jgi:Na+/H+ antiporter NhaC